MQCSCSESSEGSRRGKLIYLGQGAFTGVRYHNITARLELYFTLRRADMRSNFSSIPEDASDIHRFSIRNGS